MVVPLRPAKSPVERQGIPKIPEHRGNYGKNHIANGILAVMLDICQWNRTSGTRDEAGCAHRDRQKASIGQLDL